MSLLTERVLGEVQRRIESGSYSSFEEFNDALMEVSREGIEKVINVEGGSESERAQRLAYDAMSCEDEDEALSLAKSALDLDPDCSDAMLVLASQSTTAAEAVGHLERAVQAAARKLPPDAFTREDYVGHFWARIETRPYLRVRQQLSYSLYLMGDVAGAIEHAEEMIRLDPDDHQGVRHRLISMLIEVGRDDEASEWLNDYRGDVFSANAYLRALLQYRRFGETARAEKAMREAYKANPHVAIMILDDEIAMIPKSYVIGSAEEASLIINDQLGAWDATPDFVDWLVRVSVKQANANVLRDIIGNRWVHAKPKKRRK